MWRRRRASKAGDGSKVLLRLLPLLSASTIVVGITGCVTDCDRNHYRFYWLLCIGEQSQTVRPVRLVLYFSSSKRALKLALPCSRHWLSWVFPFEQDCHFCMFIIVWACRYDLNGYFDDALMSNDHIDMQALTFEKGIWVTSRKGVLKHTVQVKLMISSVLVVIGQTCLLTFSI